MTVSNPGFETPDATPGSALNWTFASSAPELEFAMFDVALPEGVEDFEEEWNSNEDFKFNWEDVTPEYAVFDAALDPELVEDFEEGWFGNEAYSFGFSGGIAASFDSVTPEDVEDFEEEWDLNEDFRFDWDDVLANEGAVTTLFNSDTDPAEGFEQGWNDVENYFFDFDSATSLGQKFGPGGPEEYDEEDFGFATWPDIVLGDF